MVFCWIVLWLIFKISDRNKDLGRMGRSGKAPKLISSNFKPNPTMGRLETSLNSVFLFCFLFAFLVLVVVVVVLVLLGVAF